MKIIIFIIMGLLCLTNCINQKTIITDDTSSNKEAENTSVFSAENSNNYYCDEIFIIIEDDLNYSGAEFLLNAETKFKKISKVFYEENYAHIGVIKYSENEVLEYFINKSSNEISYWSSQQIIEAFNLFQEENSFIQESDMAFAIYFQTIDVNGDKIPELVICYENAFNLLAVAEIKYDTIEILGDFRNDSYHLVSGSLYKKTNEFSAIPEDFDIAYEQENYGLCNYKDNGLKIFEYRKDFYILGFSSGQMDHVVFIRKVDFNAFNSELIYCYGFFFTINDNGDGYNEILKYKKVVNKNDENNYDFNEIEQSEIEKFLDNLIGYTTENTSQEVIDVTTENTSQEVIDVTTEKTSQEVIDVTTEKTSQETTDIIIENVELLQFNDFANVENDEEFKAKVLALRNVEDLPAEWTQNLFEKAININAVFNYLQRGDKLKLKHKEVPHTLYSLTNLCWFDRTFLDIDSDGITEMFLTFTGEGFGGTYEIGIFKIENDGIKIIYFNLDKFLMSSVFDYNPFTYEGYNSNHFAFKTLNDEHYLLGLDRLLHNDGVKETFFITKFCYLNDSLYENLYFQVLYYWFDTEYGFKYFKMKDGEITKDNYEDFLQLKAYEVNKEEVIEFLNKIY